MKNRIVSISALCSILVVILLLIPFKRDIIIKIDRSLLQDINQISIDYIYNGARLTSRDYYFKNRQSRFYSEIKDSIRLSRGEYELKIFLLYQKDRYLTREVRFEIGYLDFGEVIINVL